MREDSGITLSRLRVDGGMAANQWFLLFLASQCGLIVERPDNIEATALGVAMLAALGFGAVENLQSLQENSSGDKQFLADGDPLTMMSDYQGWLRALKMIKAEV